MPDHIEFEQRYKPEHIQLLFLAEAPADPARHFYLANTNLYRTLHLAFTDVYGPFKSADDFLTFFSSLGCYLDHLSVQPVDKSTVSRRNTSRQAGVVPLSERMNTYKPTGLLILMKSIEKQVQQAVELSAITTIEHQLVTSYPAGSESNRQTCIRDVKYGLRHWVNVKLLP